jgi:hypothetical protein
VTVVARRSRSVGDILGENGRRFLYKAEILRKKDNDPMTDFFSGDFKGHSILQRKKKRPRPCNTTGSSTSTKRS